LIYKDFYTSCKRESAVLIINDGSRQVAVKKRLPYLSEEDYPPPASCSTKRQGKL